MIAVVCVAALGFPIMVWVGIHNWRGFYALCAAWLLVIACAVLGAKFPRHDGQVRLYVVVAVMIGVGTVSVFVGPLLFVPLFAVAATQALTLAVEPRRWAAVAVAGCTSVGLPFALAQTGILPTAYEYSGGRMCIVSNVIDLSSRGAWVIFAVNLGVMVGASFMAMRFRRMLRQIENDRYTQEWQLRQLLPVGTSTRSPSWATKAGAKDSTRRSS